ncbi:AAA family ATPase, partial [Sulfoacidibacillus ferrooxidans]|uniref:AAA family ATPase n=1 Tax=Sulfoacidibacillus ferrooxidans TaxID=2005001 RepID=UPI001F5097C5
MWVFLEYNQQRIEESQGAAREHGISLHGVFREDQLSSLDGQAIEIILVGSDWSAQTIHRLRQRGVKAPVVCVVDARTPDARDRAQDLDAVDIVTYPLSFTYLTMWGKSTATAVQQSAPTELQKILGESGRLKRKQTYTMGIENNQEEIDALGQQTRARILFVHGRKGHIGKSTIVSLLANQFAASGLDVAVVDFDVSGDLAHRYGVQAHVSLREWAKLPTHMDERMVKHSLVQAGDHLFLLPSSGQENTKQDEATVKKIIYHLAAHMDVVLIDAGPEWTPQTETLLTLSHRVIYVMTSNFSSIRAYLDGYDAVLNVKGDARRILPIVSVASQTSEQKKVLHVLTERFDSLFVLGYDRLLYKQLIHQLPMTGGKKTQGTIQALALGCGIETTRRVKRVRKPIRAKKSSALAYVGMASAVAAGVVAVVLLSQISHTETIVVTSKYLAPYETVTAQDVHTVTVPDSMGISGLATNMN